MYYHECLESCQCDEIIQMANPELSENDFMTSQSIQEGNFKGSKKSQSSASPSPSPKASSKASQMASFNQMM